ncbi:hypothetical protein D9M71_680010 [compost metagenome]
MTVDEGGDIPGLLIAQAARLAQRHVVFDKRRRSVDPVHAGAPVVRVLAPQWRHHVVLRDFLPLPLGTVTDRALLLIHLLATLEVIPLRRLRHLGVATPRGFHTYRRLARQPVGIHR